MTVAELRALSAELEQRLSPSAVKVLEKRYLKRTPEGTPLEAPVDMFARVAENIAQADRLYHPDDPLDATIAEFFAVMARHIPVFQQKLNKTNQRSRLFWINIDDQVDVRFHMSTDIANAANVIDGSPSARIDLAL